MLIENSPNQMLNETWSFLVTSELLSSVLFSRLRALHQLL